MINIFKAKARGGNFRHCDRLNLVKKAKDYEKQIFTILDTIP